jgi:hypothetical protein
LLETRDDEIHVYGDAAVLWDVQASKCNYRGETIDGEFRVSHLWARQRRRWQVVGTQFTTIAARS